MKFFAQNIIYYTSVGSLQQTLPDSMADVAFVGRSNAGKSSALNVICGRQLARVGKTPGHTRLINFFSANQQQFLVDLPGYGFARVPDAIRAHWQQLVGYYLQRRTMLQGVVVVMDSRRPLTPLDWQLLNFCQPHQFPLHILLSKADKLSQQQKSQSLKNCQRQLAQQNFGHATVQLFSATKKQGADQARQQIQQWFDHAITPAD